MRTNALTIFSYTENFCIAPKVTSSITDKAKVDAKR